MDVLREREVKESLERQLLDEQKIRGKQKYNLWLFSVHSTLETPKAFEIKEQICALVSRGKLLRANTHRLTWLFNTLSSYQCLILD